MSTQNPSSVALIFSIFLNDPGEFFYEDSQAGSALIATGKF